MKCEATDTATISAIDTRLGALVETHYDRRPAKKFYQLSK